MIKKGECSYRSGIQRRAERGKETRREKQDRDRTKQRWNPGAPRRRCSAGGACALRALRLLRPAGRDFPTAAGCRSPLSANLWAGCCGLVLGNKGREAESGDGGRRWRGRWLRPRAGDWGLGTSRVGVGEETAEQRWADWGKQQSRAHRQVWAGKTGREEAGAQGEKASCGGAE